MIVINTSKGDIRLQLDQENTPITTENFLSYVRAGFYNNTIFHRVIDKFMIQGGGLHADMTQKKTENAIKNRYKGVEEFLKTAPSMIASEAYVKPNGSVVFGDGRHRFAYLRDQGLDKIPISMDKESIKNAKKYGYID